MFKNYVVLILVLLLSAFSQAQAPVAAASCIACHGEKGISSNSLWPNLAGQKREYLEKQIKAFKNGDRKDPVMSAMTANLSDSEIASLAKYFSELSK